MRRLTDLGELDLIDRIERRFRRIGPPPRAGVGEDAAILRPRPGVEWAISTDQFLEGVHFRRAWVPPGFIGGKALAANLSDMAAMGAKPIAWFLLLGLPEGMPESDFESLLGGMARLARRHRIRLAGGDTCAFPRLSVGITIIGELPRGGGLRRGGARPGDRICVSGPLGGSALGLRLLRRGWRWRAGRAVPPAGWRGGPDRMAAASAALSAHLDPDPPVEAAGRVAARRLARAGIDLSDGLALDLTRLCRAGRVGAVIDAASIPPPPGLDLLAPRRSRLDLLLGGGEDYEILIAVPPGRLPGLAKLRFGGRRFHPIGEIRPRRHGIRLRDAAGRLRPLPPSGFRHFAA